MRTRTITILSTCCVLWILSGSCRQSKSTAGSQHPSDGPSETSSQELKITGVARDQFGILPETVNGFAVTRGAAPGYVDDQACKVCHQNLFESYQDVGMARSFYPPGPDVAIEGMDKPYYHPASKRYYVMTRRDGKLVQKRYCLDTAGKPFAEFETEVAWIMGSGKHGRSFLSQSKRGELFLLPLGWYAEAGWRMSPGYDNPDHPRFERVIDRACMFCHNAYPEVPVGSDLPHKDPRYPHSMPHGIGCQRCHGPGARHVESAADPEASDETIRARILNPADFSPRQRDELCMTCHLQPEVGLGEMMPRAFDKPVFSHRPGDPLAAFLTFLDHGTKAEQRDRFQINHHAYRLRQSKCHEASGGKLTCLSCHDPHRKMKAAERAAHYRNKCLQCHQLKDCQHEEMGHGRDPAQSDCTSCHMTKARPSDIVHATVTDHLIRRKPASRDLAAPRKESKTAAGARKIVAYFKDAADTPRTATYVGIGQASVPTTGSSKRWLAAFKASGPHPVAGYVNVGRGLIEMGDQTRAIDLLREGVRRFPQSAEAHWTLGSAHLANDDTQLALKSLKLARDRDPGSPGIAATLGDAYLKAGDRQAAREHYESAIASRPTSWRTWQQYGYVLQLLEDGDAAERAYLRAIALNPDDLYSYRALGALHEAAQDWRAMFKILEKGATRSLDLELHLVMCWLFTPDPRVRQPARALARTRDLTREHPDNPRTHLHLALALYSSRAASGVPAAVERAHTLGADPACCLGLLLVDSLRRNDRRTAQNLLIQFERARQTSTTEPLRRIVDGLVRATLPEQKRK